MSESHIDRYVLRGLLGEGNMGRVYLAYDPKFNREVAVKTIRDTMRDNPEVRRWFHREARAMAQLQHPGIVEVHDYSGQETAQPYLVMERLHGHTLQSVKDKRGVFPDAAVCEVAIQLGLAVAHAHAQGLIHRDLKPDNVFVEPSGRLVITDFGLARAQMNVDLGASLASAGTAVVGTPLYMAPETIHDPKSASPRSDIYAIGIILYALATMEVPFSAPDPFQALSRILNGTHKSVQELRKDMPRVLADAIERSFAMNVDARPQSGEALEQLFATVRERIAPNVDSLQVLREFLTTTDEFNAFTVARAIGAATPAAEDTSPATQVTAISGTGAETQIGPGQDTQKTQIATLPGGRAQTQVTTAPGGTQTRVVTTVPSSSPKRSKLGLVVVVAIGGLAVGSGWWWRGRSKAPADVDGATATPLPPRSPEPLPSPEPPAIPPPLPQAPPVNAAPTPVAPAATAAAPPQRPTPPPKPLGPPGILKVNTGSVWADIYINGEKRGQTPMKATVELPPGKYTVRLVNPDYGSQEHSVTISSGNATPLKTALTKK